MHCINIPQMPNQLESCPPISLQHTATRCNTLQVIASHCNSLQLTATHCNSLQLTATHCNTLQHICNALQQPTTDAKSAGKLSSDDFDGEGRREEVFSQSFGRGPLLQHTTTHCNTLQHTATHCNTLQHTATHGNTLQHTGTHAVRYCNPLQHHCNTIATPPQLLQNHCHITT